MRKTIFSSIVVLLIPFFVLADGTLMYWGAKDLEGMTEERFELAKKWTVADILQNNIAAETWPETYLVAVGASKKKDSVVRLFIDQLVNGTQTQLRLTSRLIIWERILSGDILFEGKGFQTDDDLFSVAGRANWVLRNITKKNFGYVKPNATAADLLLLQNKWKQWLEGKPTEEYLNPFDSKKQGLDETHSLVAFEALIYSLKSSEQKTALINRCLQQIYKLDKLPEDKNNPASFCNPDNYTLFLFKRVNQ